MNTYKLTHHYEGRKSTTLELHGRSLFVTVFHHLSEIRRVNNRLYRTDCFYEFEVKIRRCQTATEAIEERRLIKVLASYNISVEVLDYCGGWISSLEYHTSK